MAVLQKKKVLFISPEMAPYNEETDFARILTALAVKSNDSGYEVRAIMPRFGTINERRHRLHEVVRLSGINITVDKEDYPLLPSTKAVHSSSADKTSCNPYREVRFR